MQWGFCVVVWRLCAVGCGTERDSANLHLLICACTRAPQSGRASLRHRATERPYVWTPRRLLLALGDGSGIRRGHRRDLHFPERQWAEMLLRAVRALSARQHWQTGGGESGGAVPGVAAAGRDAAPGEFTRISPPPLNARFGDALGVCALSDIRFLLCLNV